MKRSKVGLFWTKFFSEPKAYKFEDERTYQYAKKIVFESRGFLDYNHVEMDDKKRLIKVWKKYGSSNESN